MLYEPRRASGAEGVRDGMSGVGLQLVYLSFIMKLVARMTDAALSDLPLVNAVFTGL